MQQAEAGIVELQSKVDSLVVIPNDRIKHVTDQKISGFYRELPTR